MNARPGCPSDTSPTLRLRRLYDLEPDEGEPADALAEAQIDAVLMPRPIPAPDDARSLRHSAREVAGLRWGLLVSLLAWAALIAALATHA